MCVGRKEGRGGNNRVIIFLQGGGEGEEGAAGGGGGGGRERERETVVSDQDGVPVTLDLAPHNHLRIFLGKSFYVVPNPVPANKFSQGSDI
jgi:hypothetical protein